ncbi:N-(5'-phosphoribosyl)anthranilate isomerase [Larkinella soli]|uniref:N-(5'-phosphoribosyl)anthranilate isomerase n=1 Tax=Larkinella soli TaxID=1770527 RepID=UPI000FFB71D8|nr:N-(5'-phosphoribosyl)anthranilate isomerase [Larkinella soli]
MPLRTTVKISNVTNLSDARYCAGMGVDLLGFSMDAGTEQYVAPEKFNEIRSWVAGVHIVGETTSTDPLEIERLLGVYQPDVVQVEESALVPYLKSFDRPVILKADLGQLTLDQLDALFAAGDRNDPPAPADYFLLESKGAIRLDDELKAALQRLAARYPVLLGTGVSAGNVHELLSELPIQGIALTGGDEESPGNKEFGEMMDILEALETEE